MKNNLFEALLDEYEQLTDCLCELLRREQSNMNQGLSLDETVDEKRTLLESIGDLNVRLQAFGRERLHIVAETKTRLEVVQNRLMLAIKLDRSLEKTFLSKFANPLAPKLDPAPRQVSQAYLKQVGNGSLTQTPYAS